MTVYETGNVQGLNTLQTSTGKKAGYNSKDNNLQTTSIFTQSKTQTESKKEETNETSKDSLIDSFKDFLKWNLSGGILGSLVRGDLDSVIDGFKKETGLSDTDLALGAISPAYGAFKIAANAFKDDVKDIYNEENNIFGEVSTNLDFES